MMLCGGQLTMLSLMGLGKFAMCYFGELDGTGFVEQFLQLFFLTAGCVVSYTGLLLAILLIGFLPLYIYSYFALSGKTDFSHPKGKLCGIAALFLSVLLSCVFWLSAAVMGTWG